MTLTENNVTLQFALFAQFLYLKGRLVQPPTFPLHLTNTGRAPSV